MSTSASLKTALGRIGWLPILAVEENANGKFIRLAGWGGLSGTPPTDYVGSYMGASGWVLSEAEAVNVASEGGGLDMDAVSLQISAAIGEVITGIAPAADGVNLVATRQNGTTFTIELPGATGLTASTIYNQPEPAIGNFEEVYRQVDGSTRERYYGRYNSSTRNRPPGDNARGCFTRIRCSQLETEIRASDSVNNKFWIGIYNSSVSNDIRWSEVGGGAVDLPSWVSDENELIPQPKMPALTQAQLNQCMALIAVYARATDPELIPVASIEGLNALLDGFGTQLQVRQNRLWVRSRNAADLSSIPLSDITAGLATEVAFRELQAAYTATIGEIGSVVPDLLNTNKIFGRYNAATTGKPAEVTGSGYFQRFYDPNGASNDPLRFELWEDGADGKRWRGWKMGGNNIVWKELIELSEPEFADRGNFYGVDADGNIRPLDIVPIIQANAPSGGGGNVPLSETTTHYLIGTPPNQLQIPKAAVNNSNPVVSANYTGATKTLTFTHEDGTTSPVRLEDFVTQAELDLIETEVGNNALNIANLGGRIDNIRQVPAVSGTENNVLTENADGTTSFQPPTGGGGTPSGTPPAQHNQFTDQQHDNLVDVSSITRVVRHANTVRERNPHQHYGFTPDGEVLAWLYAENILATDAAGDYTWNGESIIPATDAGHSATMTNVPVNERHHYPPGHQRSIFWQERATWLENARARINLGEDLQNNPRKFMQITLHTRLGVELPADTAPMVSFGGLDLIRVGHTDRLYISIPGEAAHDRTYTRNDPLTGTDTRWTGDSSGNPVISETEFSIPADLNGAQVFELRGMMTDNGNAATRYELGNNDNFNDNSRDVFWQLLLNVPNIAEDHHFGNLNELEAMYANGSVLINNIQILYRAATAQKGAHFFIRGAIPNIAYILTWQAFHHNSITETIPAAAERRVRINDNDAHNENGIEHPEEFPINSVLTFAIVQEIPNEGGNYDDRRAAIIVNNNGSHQFTIPLRRTLGSIPDFAYIDVGNHRIQMAGVNLEQYGAHGRDPTLNDLAIAFSQKGVPGLGVFADVPHRDDELVVEGKVLIRDGDSADENPTYTNVLDALKESGGGSTTPAPLGVVELQSSTDNNDGFLYTLPAGVVSFHVDIINENTAALSGHEEYDITILTADLTGSDKPFVTDTHNPTAADHRTVGVHAHWNETTRVVRVRPVIATNTIHRVYYETARAVQSAGGGGLTLSADMLADNGGEMARGQSRTIPGLDAAAKIHICGKRISGSATFRNTFTIIGANKQGFHEDQVSGLNRIVVQLTGNNGIRLSINSSTTATIDCIFLETQ